MSHPVTPRQDPAHVRPRGPAISWCGIPGFPYAIRNSEFGIPESGIGNSEKRQIMVRSDAFRWTPRKHWSECGSQISSWCGIFPLDKDESGAVGWSANNENNDENPHSRPLAC